MKFLADMGISPRVVEELRQQGYDAVHLLDESLYRDMRAININRHLFSILKGQSEPLKAGAVLSVTEQKVRIRILPI